MLNFIISSNGTIEFPELERFFQFYFQILDCEDLEALKRFDADLNRLKSEGPTEILQAVLHRIGLAILGSLLAFKRAKFENAPLRIEAILAETRRNQKLFDNIVVQQKEKKFSSMLCIVRDAVGILFQFIAADCRLFTGEPNDWLEECEIANQYAALFTSGCRGYHEKGAAVVASGSLLQLLQQGRFLHALHGQYTGLQQGTNPIEQFTQRVNQELCRFLEEASRLVTEPPYQTERDCIEALLFQRPLLTEWGMEQRAKVRVIKLDPVLLRKQIGFSLPKAVEHFLSVDRKEGFVFTGQDRFYDYYDQLEHAEADVRSEIESKLSLAYFQLETSLLPLQHVAESILLHFLLLLAQTKKKEEPGKIRTDFYNLTESINTFLATKNTGTLLPIHLYRLIIKAQILITQSFKGVEDLMPLCANLLRILEYSYDYDRLDKQEESPEWERQQAQRDIEGILKHLEVIAPESQRPCIASFVENLKFPFLSRPFKNGLTETASANLESEIKILLNRAEEIGLQLLVLQHPNFMTRKEEYSSTELLSQSNTVLIRLLSYGAELSFRAWQSKTIIMQQNFEHAVQQFLVQFVDACCYFVEPEQHEKFLPLLRRAVELGRCTDFLPVFIAPYARLLEVFCNITRKHREGLENKFILALDKQYHSYAWICLRSSDQRENIDNFPLLAWLKHAVVVLAQTEGNEKQVSDLVLSALQLLKQFCIFPEAFNGESLDTIQQFLRALEQIATREKQITPLVAHILQNKLEFLQDKPDIAIPESLRETLDAVPDYFAIVAERYNFFNFRAFHQQSIGILAATDEGRLQQYSQSFRAEIKRKQAMAKAKDGNPISRFCAECDLLILRYFQLLCAFKLDQLDRLRDFLAVLRLAIDAFRTTLKTGADEYADLAIFQEITLPRIELMLSLLALHIPVKSAADIASSVGKVTSACREATYQRSLVLQRKLNHKDIFDYLDYLESSDLLMNGDSGSKEVRVYEDTIPFHFRRMDEFFDKLMSVRLEYLLQRCDEFEVRDEVRAHLCCFLSTRTYHSGDYPALREKNLARLQEHQVLQNFFLLTETDSQCMVALAKKQVVNTLPAINKAAALKSVLQFRGQQVSGADPVLAAFDLYQHVLFLYWSIATPKRLPSTESQANPALALELDGYFTAAQGCSYFLAERGLVTTGMEITEANYTSFLETLDNRNFKDICALPMARGCMQMLLAAYLHELKLERPNLVEKYLAKCEVLLARFPKTEMLLSDKTRLEIWFSLGMLSFSLQTKQSTLPKIAWKKNQNKEFPLFYAFSQWCHALAAGLKDKQAEADAKFRSALPTDLLADPEFLDLLSIDFLKLFKARQAELAPELQQRIAALKVPQPSKAKLLSKHAVVTVKQNVQHEAEQPESAQQQLNVQGAVFGSGSK